MIYGPRRQTLGERQVEEVGALAGLGANAFEIGQALGVSCRALQKTCHAHGRNDLAALFTDEVRHEREMTEARTQPPKRSRAKRSKAA